MKLKLESIISRVAIWLLASSFFMVIGEILWDAAVAETAVSAGIFGLILFLRLDLFTETGVFAQEKEFDALQDAKEWLTATYPLELEKHQQRNHQQTNHNQP